MNSPFANIYLQISDRLKAIVPEVRYINIDIGQLENYTERPPVSFPCVLIDFQDFSFSEMGEGVQQAEGNIVVRLAYNPFSDASSLSSDVVRAKALTFLETEYAINAALHNWQGTSFGYLVRKSAITEKRDDDLRVRELIYNTCFEDTSASNTYSPLPEDISSTIQLEWPSGNVITVNP